MLLWKQRDESKFGQIIRKLDDMMKEVKEKPKGDMIYLVTCFLDKTKFIARIKD